MLREFRQFVMRGNVLDLAIAFILGAAFTGIVQSMVNDLIMPPIGLLLGDVNFSDFFIVLKEGTTPGPYASPDAAKAAGAITWNYGRFVTAVITFLIVAFILFMLIRGFNNAQRRMDREKQAAPAAPTTKQCPQCFSTIDIKATRCAFCTSALPAAP